MSEFTEQAWGRARRLREESATAHNLCIRIGDKMEAGQEVCIKGADDLTVILDALTEYTERKRQRAREIETNLNAGDEYGDLRSHEEKHILEGCVNLMGRMAEELVDWLRYAEDGGCICLEDVADSGVLFNYCISYGEIVNTLFLHRTGHSGGTSTAAKCRTLGVDSADAVVFEIKMEDESEE